MPTTCVTLMVQYIPRVVHAVMNNKSMACTYKPSFLQHRPCRLCYDGVAFFIATVYEREGVRWTLSRS
jgi:hypothetical protein